ncbi:MAG TPA: hypothetical protein DCM40_37790 [Maribacter sp.]|nr:hypothetical protein [Maribacter sp.]
MTMYCQDIFDHPVCILKGRPTLIRNYFNEERLQKYKTGVSLAVYLQPKTDIEKATEFFVDLYSEKGRVIA